MKPPIVTKIIIFPSYVRGKRDQNDLALVRLATPMEFKPKTVQPICLPSGVSIIIYFIVSLDPTLSYNV